MSDFMRHGTFLTFFLVAHFSNPFNAFANDGRRGQPKKQTETRGGSSHAHETHRVVWTTGKVSHNYKVNGTNIMQRSLSVDEHHPGSIGVTYESNGANHKAAPIKAEARTERGRTLSLRFGNDDASAEYSRVFESYHLTQHERKKLSDVVQRIAIINQSHFEGKSQYSVKPFRGDFKTKSINGGRHVVNFLARRILIKKQLQGAEMQITEFVKALLSGKEKVGLVESYQKDGKTKHRRYNFENINQFWSWIDESSLLVTEIERIKKQAIVDKENAKQAAIANKEKEKELKKTAPQREKEFDSLDQELKLRLTNTLSGKMNDYNKMFGDWKISSHGEAREQYIKTGKFVFIFNVYKDQRHPIENGTTGNKDFDYVVTLYSVEDLGAWIDKNLN